LLFSPTPLTTATSQSTWIKIRFVRPSSDGTSIIHFDGDQSLPVKESGDDIARLSAKAKWA
jgi:hypothetical protein